MQSLYASARPTIMPNGPGSSWGSNTPAGAEQKDTAGGMVQANEFLRGYALENWLPWLWEAVVQGARFLRPQVRANAWESPVDLDAGEHIQRWGSFPSGSRPFPYPWITGTVSGFCPMLDQYSIAYGFAKNAWGPGVNTPIPVPWDAQYPTLHKVTG